VFFGVEVMPKLKSNRGAAKRFRSVAKGGYKCRSANRNHMLSSKTMKRKRHLRAGFRVREEDSGRIEQMLPYTKG
jgi:large subunit ribosomal protein L35